MKNTSTLIPVNKTTTKKVTQINHARLVSMSKKVDIHNFKLNFRANVMQIKKYSDLSNIENLTENQKNAFNVEQIETSKKVFNKILRDKNNEFKFFEIACKTCKHKKTGYYNQYLILCKLNAILKFGDKKENKDLNLTQLIMQFNLTNKY